MSASGQLRSSALWHCHYTPPELTPITPDLSGVSRLSRRRSKRLRCLDGLAALYKTRGGALPARLGPSFLSARLRSCAASPALKQDVEPTRKGMAVTRSAGTPMVSLAVLQQAITAHATRAAEKLRRHGLVASHMQVFFHTNPHNNTPRNSTSRTARLSPPSNATTALVGTALACAARAWKGDPAGNGFAYTKAGLILDDLIPQELAPVDLFAHEQAAAGRLSAALDAVNDRWGKKTLILASEGFKQPFATKADMRSPRYTTRLSDLPLVRA